MSNKFSQDVSGGSLEQFLATAPNNPQALVLSAYLEEKKKWEEVVRELTVDKFDKIRIVTDITIRLETAQFELDDAKALVKSESGFVKSISKIFRFKTKKQKRVLKLEKEIENLKAKYEEAEASLEEVSQQFTEMASSPPSTDRWELALMGNKLFSAKK